MRETGVVIVLVSALLTGCTAHQNARELSRQTLAQVVEYEGSLRQLSSSFERNYANSHDRLKYRIETMYAASNIVAMERMAEDAADDVMSKGFSAARFRDFIRQVIREQTEMQSVASTALADLTAHHDQMQASTKLKMKKLQTVRAKLERLQLEPSYEDHFKRLKPLFDELRTVVEEARERDASSSSS